MIATRGPDGAISPSVTSEVPRRAPALGQGEPCAGPDEEAPRLELAAVAPSRAQAKRTERPAVDKQRTRTSTASPRAWRWLSAARKIACRGNHPSSLARKAAAL